MEEINKITENGSAQIKNEQPEEQCLNCQTCLKDEIRAGFTGSHALFVQSLGICSAIALTGYVHTSLVIGIIILLTALLSAFAVSLMRRLLFRRARFLVQVSIITAIVTGVHLLLQRYWPGMRDALGPYLGLVITNCIIMDSCEQAGIIHPPLKTMKKVLGSTIGYIMLLIAIAVIREPLGHGSFAGIRIIPGNIRPLALVAAAPGAFFIMGLIWWCVKAISGRISKEKKYPESADSEQ